MKNTKHKLLLLLILVIPILFLTSCDDLSDDDWELLEVAFESWAEENGLLENDQWQPDGVVIKAVENTVKDITNDEKNVQLDGLDVIKQIEEADNLAEDAWLTYDGDKMQEAVNMRPNDWRLHEQEDAFTLHNDSISEGYSNESDNLIREQVQRGADCVNLRIQQLEYRASLLEPKINRNNETHLEMQSIQLQAQEELQGIYATGQTPFCDELK